MTTGDDGPIIPSPRSCAHDGPHTPGCPTWRDIIDYPEGTPASAGPARDGNETLIQRLRLSALGYHAGAVQRLFTEAADALAARQAPAAGVDLGYGFCPVCGRANGSMGCRWYCEDIIDYPRG